MKDYILGKRDSGRLPLIYQTEDSECGLVCLLMVAGYFGCKVDLLSARRKFSTSQRGITLDALIDIAGELDLGARALRLDIKDIKHVKKPCILHWEFNHFVVLKSFNGKGAEIHDPASGIRTVSLEQLSRSFTGIALELTPTETFKPIVAKQTMKLSELWGDLIGIKRFIFQILLLSILLQVFVILTPFFLQLVVDEVITTFDTSLLIILFLAFASIALIEAFTGMLRSWISVYFGQQMTFQMISNVFEHLVNLPTKYYERRHVGDIISRINSTIPIRTALTKSLVTVFIDGLMALITLFVIYAYSVELANIVLLLTSLLLIASFLIFPKMRRAQEAAIITGAIEHSHKIETIEGATPIKLMSAQSNRVATWRNLFSDHINATISYERLAIAFKFFEDFLPKLQILLVVYFGALAVLNSKGEFTVGMLFAFLSFQTTFTTSIKNLAEKIIEFRFLGLHLERIADIVKNTRETSNANATDSTSSTFDGDISLDDVSFRYSETDPYVLKHINIHIPKGSFVCITGDSGSGKTTLLKLILGLYSPTEGTISIAGQTLTERNTLNWRKQYGVVMQDDELFSGSIIENITFFSFSPNIERSVECAKLAGLHNEIMDMPMQYNSKINGLSASISGGQKQRILLARALYLRPNFLFLDEGTANLDAGNEQRIVDLLKNKDWTVITVAHREIFTNAADYVFDIKCGKLSEIKQSKKLD